MVDQRYLRPGLHFAIGHVVEECGEVMSALGQVLAAAGKTQRWGPASVNPTLPRDQQETNLDWLKREIADLRGALDRFDKAAEKFETPPLLR